MTTENSGTSNVISKCWSSPVQELVIHALNVILVASVLLTAGSTLLLPDWVGGIASSCTVQPRQLSLMEVWHRGHDLGRTSSTWCICDHLHHLSIMFLSYLLFMFVGCKVTIKMERKYYTVFIVLYNLAQWCLITCEVIKLKKKIHTYIY